MIIYVIKDGEKYLHYSEHGYGYEWVDHITKATQFSNKEIADNCCYKPWKVVAVKVEEVE